MLKLKRLKIDRYRDVEPCDLRFSDRFNVLLGPNGAGKTTLLNLISKVLRTKLDDPADPVSIELELTHEHGTIAGKIATAAPKASVALPGVPRELLVSMPVGARAVVPMQWPMFEIRFAWHDRPAAVDVRREGDAMTVETGSHGKTSLELSSILLMGGVLALASSLAHTAALRASPLGGSAILNASRFDESVDLFRAVTARHDDPTALVTEFQIDIGGVRSEGEAGLYVFAWEGMVPSSIERMIARHFAEGAKDVSCESTELAFLTDVVRLLGLRSATAKLELLDKQVFASGSEQFHFGNLKFWFTRRDGSIFQDQHLSYGQKRLLAFLYYLEANPDIIIADELVNGLHHAWIEACVNAIGERQAFLTSQNPLLLDYLVFESVEQVKESFILCRTEPDGDRDRMIWRNMTDDEADMFYRAYKVGIEHVGEILRTRGLW